MSVPQKLKPSPSICIKRKTLLPQCTIEAFCRRPPSDSQEQFWQRFGVPQGSGSRYEKGRPLPRPLAILFSLVYAQKILTPSMMAKHSRAMQKYITDNSHPLQIYRDVRSTPQKAFWAQWGATQANGSFYENGRRVPFQILLLMWLVAHKVITEEDLRNARRLVNNPAKEKK